MLRKKFTENSIYSQFFSFEVLDYFDSISTNENYEWIVKYFDVITKDENKTSKKYNQHHIRPCCTFKDENHKNRTQTQELGDAFNGNIIKLSVYNHLFAHFYLWKIFDTIDLRTAFQRMCGQGKYIDNLTEEELREIATLKEDCAKKNQTEEERKDHQKQWKEEHKDEISEYHKNRYKEKKEEILKRQKENRENNKEEILKRAKIWRDNNKDKTAKSNKKWYENNKEDILKRQKEKYEKDKEKVLKRNKKWEDNNKDKVKEYRKELNRRECYDPIKKEPCTYRTLRARKGKNKELYKDVILINCVVGNKISN